MAGRRPTTAATRAGRVRASCPSPHWPRPRPKPWGRRLAPARSAFPTECRRSLPTARSLGASLGIADAAGRRPFLDAGEMVVIAETTSKFRIGAGQVGRIDLGELFEQNDQFGIMQVDDRAERLILELQFAHL